MCKALHGTLVDGLACAQHVCNRHQAATQLRLLLLYPTTLAYALPSAHLCSPLEHYTQRPKKAPGRHVMPLWAEPALPNRHEHEYCHDTRSWEVGKSTDPVCKPETQRLSQSLQRPAMHAGTRAGGYARRLQQQTTQDADSAGRCTTRHAGVQGEAEGTSCCYGLHSASLQARLRPPQCPEMRDRGLSRSERAPRRGRARACARW